MNELRVKHSSNFQQLSQDDIFLLLKAWGFTRKGNSYHDYEAAKKIISPEYHVYVAKFLKV